MDHEYAALPKYTQTAGQFRRLGITVPPALAKGIESLRAEQAAAVATLDGTPAALERVAAALLTTQGDPLDLDEVRRAAALVALAGSRVQVGAAVEAAVDQRARALVRKHLPALVAALAAELTRRGEYVTAARKVLPSVDLTRADRPQVAADHLTTWAHAREAVEAVPTILAAWHAAHEAAHGTSPGNRDAALIVADLDAATLDRLNRKPGGSAVHAVAEGVPLQLADLPTYLARSKRADAERAAERKRRAERDEASRNRSLSMSVSGR